MLSSPLKLLRSKLFDKTRTWLEKSGEAYKGKFRFVVNFRVWMLVLLLLLISIVAVPILSHLSLLPVLSPLHAFTKTSTLTPFPMLTPPTPTPLPSSTPTPTLTPKPTSTPTPLPTATPFLTATSPFTPTPIVVDKGFRNGLEAQPFIESECFWEEVTDDFKVNNSVGGKRIKEVLGLKQIKSGFFLKEEEGKRWACIVYPYSSRGNLFLLFVSSTGNVIWVKIVE